MMLTVEQIAEIRLSRSRGESIRSIAIRCGYSRNTIRKILRNDETEHNRVHTCHAVTKITGYEEDLNNLLKERDNEDRKHQMTVKAIYQMLQQKGFEGGYDVVRRYAKKWNEEHNSGVVMAYVPLMFHPGEAFQFDWCEEKVIIKGVLRKVYVAHVRLCYSRMKFVKAYPRMSLEMVLSAHIEAHDYFEGLPKRGIYDNLKTVVTKIFKGKEREYNKEFTKLASHYQASNIFLQNTKNH